MIRISLIMLAICYVFSSAAFAAPLDPCKLLTQAQVSQAFGERVAPAQRQPSASGHPICGWRNASQSKTLYVMIASRKTMPPPWWKTAIPVRGIGDKAFWSSGWMYVKKHASGVAIELILSPNSAKHMDPQLLTLAKEITARMP
ncbi:MAG: hypothetical protein M0Z43_05945 [Acidithiobacillus sp.]|nr:hypothetical protein [Acidithiobacillus sp.]